MFREIGLRVGYTYDTDYFKRQIYYPRAFGDVEADALKLRKTLTQALTENGLKIQIVNDPQNAQSIATNDPSLKSK